MDEHVAAEPRAGGGVEGCRVQRVVEDPGVAVDGGHDRRGRHPGVVVDVAELGGAELEDAGCGRGIRRQLLERRENLRARLAQRREGQGVQIEGTPRPPALLVSDGGRRISIESTVVEQPAKRRIETVGRQQPPRTEIRAARDS